MPLRYLLIRCGAIGIIPHWDLKAFELLSGLASIGWALMVIFADAYHSNPAYEPFLAFAPPWVWSLMMGVTGISQTVACLWHRPLLTRYSALAGVFQWSFTVLALWQISPRLASLPLYLLLAIGCGWLHVRG